ncbi:hypothetical protein [Corynebacterium diphtheriae]|uniref:hypothetical protein n=2 Tax=Corynebacterium diphtheriae TaxID=1717 RepID=UPI0018CB0051|nr:hypothetical protein [Corynebacterium diphtheriae]MBG9256161.1 hypothetical protein [Corynebacterium diphtheriae bv. mitis]
MSSSSKPSPSMNAPRAQPGKTMNKCCKDIFAYFDHYILRCLIHAANIRHTINALYNRKGH